MKYRVNDDCIGCGNCESVCPEVFTVTDGRSNAKEVVPEGAEAAAEQAKEECPVSAIESL